MRPRRLLHHALLDAATDPERAGKTVVISDGHEYTYAMLLDQSLRLAATLRAQGVRRGDRVAIYMDNTWPCVVAIHATMLAGAVFVVINPQTKADKLAFILCDCNARALCSDGHLSAEFILALPHAPEVGSVICSGKIAPQSGVIAFDDALRTAPLNSSDSVIPLDLAALVYTSGSSGSPKGVMQTHQAMVFTVGSLTQYLRLSADDRIMLVLPMAFDYGLYQLLMTVHLGATLVIERSFAFPAQVFARMREQRVTVLPAVPTMYSLILSIHAREPLSFPDVTRVTNTAAHLPDHFAVALRQIFPNALIYKMYGLTECKRVCYLEPELIDSKPGSVGKAIPGTEVYLLAEDGSPTPPGEVGILHVRGPHVMVGYWNRADLSEQMLRPGRLPGERVLCTHDRFKMDGDGFLYFIGRNDEIIKTRGEKVSPIEVEEALQKLAGVREAAVLGYADELLGQAIRAYVVLEPESGLDERRMRAHCVAHLENFMVPKEFVVLGELPKTPTGKISKRLLVPS